MRKLDENKLAKLHTAGELLDRKYGEIGTESRTSFHENQLHGIMARNCVIVVRS